MYARKQATDTKHLREWPDALCRTGWLPPWWPNLSLKVLPPNACPSSWCPMQMPNMGFCPNSCCTVCTAYGTADGSPCIDGTSQMMGCMLDKSRVAYESDTHQLLLLHCLNCIRYNSWTPCMIAMSWMSKHMLTLCCRIPKLNFAKYREFLDK